MGKRKLLLPPNYLFLYLILAIILNHLFTIKQIAPTYRIFGIIPIIFGLAVNLWADNLFKKNKTTVKPDGIPTHLITNGPFRFSRHPMYLGFVMILFGVSITLGSLSSLISPFLMFVTLKIKFIPNEETQMEKLFKENYIEYKKRVRQWI